MICRLKLPSTSVAFLFCVVVLCLGCNAVETNTVTDKVIQRHNLLPSNKNAFSEYPDSLESKSMVSPCKPERGGYFGGTSGEPATLQYGFELESVMNADISDALFMIREHLMDTIFSITFPSICSFRDLSLTQERSFVGDIVGVTGFSFGENYDAVRKFQNTIFPRISALKYLPRICVLTLALSFTL